MTQTENPFRALLQQSERAPIGTWLMSGASSTAEAMGHAGFDWLLVDMEHVPVDVSDTLALLQAVAGTPAVPIVRVAWNDPVLVKRVMDAGAQTIMFPFVQNAEEAARAVAATRYPDPDSPIEGRRGFAVMHRASRYGTLEGYVRRANALSAVIVQIETPAAITNLDAIAAVPGVDAVFLGPGDLSASLGRAGDIGHEEVQAEIASFARRCRSLGMPCGIVGATPDMVGRFVRYGFDYVAIASDMGMMMRQATAFLHDLRSASTAAT